MVRASLFSFAALSAAVLFRPFVGGRAPGRADDRSPGLGAVGGVSSAHWVDGFIREETVEIATNTVQPPPETVAQTVSDPFDWLDDSCIGCPSKGPSDCNRCAYFLASIDKISLETVFTTPETVAPPLPYTAPSAPVRIADRAKAKKPSLPPKVAAKQFVDHIRTLGIVQLTSGELRKQYYDFCDVDGRRYTAENHMRKEFLKIPGVAKEKIWIGPTDDKRRETYWTVQPEVDATPVAPAKLRLLDPIPVLREAA